MIRVTIDQKDSRICQVICEGHAEYSEKGSDIICAAVSALMINTANSLERLTTVPLTVEEGDKEDGYLRISVEEESDPAASILLDSLKLGLTSIQENYGNEYLRIIISEH